MITFRNLRRHNQPTDTWRFAGEKIKNEKDAFEQQARDQSAASKVYSQPRATQFGRSSSDSSGVPWGGFSMGHVFECGQAREQEVTLRKSRDASAYFAQTRDFQPAAGLYGCGYAGFQDGSSCLLDQFFPGTCQLESRVDGQAGTCDAVGTYSHSRGRGGLPRPLSSSSGFASFEHPTLRSSTPS
jgi:hypothetical protein